MSNQTTNINSQFFKGLYKEVWRKEIPDGLTEAEVDFIEEMGNLDKGNKILDIMCGYGRHALELARRGYNVTAIDNSQDYIDEIKDKAAEQNLSVFASQEDVSESAFQGKYDSALCMGNSFAFFDADTANSILAKLYNCLKSEGVFIINTWMIGEIAIKYFEEKKWYYIHDYKFFTDSKYLFNPTRIETEYTMLAASGEMETIKGIDYIFSLAELEAMLNRAGFQISGIYSTPRKRKFVFGERRAYIVAVKQ